MTVTLELERTLRATAGELFAAFGDAERLRLWFWPLETPPDTLHADAAGFTAGWRHPEVTITAQRRHAVADRELVFSLVHGTGAGAATSTLHVTLLPVDGGTRVVLRHEGVAAAARDDVVGAWNRCLGRLIAACPRALDAYYGRLQHPPGFRSPCGGLWPDRPDAEQRLRDKQARGVLDDADAARFRHWLAHGFVELPGAVPHAWIDRLLAEIERDWTHGNDAVTVERCEPGGGFLPMRPELRELKTKVLEYHAVSPTARDIQFAPAIRRFLTQLFERPPLAFQSLLFRWGTEQAMHQDTAYVVLRSPMEFVGCWIALEDVQAGSGELQYHVGSHRIPEYFWFGRSRSRPPGFEDERAFLQWVQQQSVQAGCPLQRFLPKKGDALVWHADLVHGGSPRVHRALTRQSLVTHYCPLDVEPEGVADGRHSRPVEHAPGVFTCQPRYGKRG